MKAAGLTSIFHRWKLHPASSDLISGQVVESDPPLAIWDTEEETPHEEYELLEVADCRQIRKFGIQYKATYIGPWDEWNTDSS